MIFNIKSQFSNMTKNPNLAFWLVLFAFSLFTIFAMGRHGAETFIYGIWLYLSLYILKRLSNKFFTAYLIFTAVTSAMYLPVGVMYGKLTKGIAFSLFETNSQESFEFLSSIDLKSIVCLILYILLFFYLLKLNKQVKLIHKKSKGFTVLCIIIALSILVKPISKMIKHKSLSVAHLSNIKYYPLRQVFTLSHRYHEYLTNKKMMRAMREIQPVWQFEDKHLKYNTYVLVLGESMRRDYMSVYGYPLDTTPFLAKTNATIFNNFISASQNTRLSLERMLFQNKAIEESIASNTPVTLANSLGMDTYWLSNQGVYSNYDVFATSVGIRSDEAHFLNEGDSGRDNHSDLELLPIFKKVLAKKSNKPKLIVLHLVGSHWNFCERIDPNYQIKPIKNYINDDVSCYLTSYRQTDKLIEKLYQNLQQTKDSFSLMYLADHGYDHKNKTVTKLLTLRHGGKYKQNYQVPFIILSSDDTKQKYIDAPRSGYYFMNAFAEWLGVKEKSLTLKAPFFSEENIFEPIKVFDGEKVINYQSLKDDPVIIEKIE